ncbi:MAG: AAA family ATPase [Pseudomonadota bacterium]|nr:AAA family ATPase [Pseudomonadota bacterium]
MKLQRLTLANFRGFDQIELDIATDVTVIAGVNGVGKSGVLKALASAMSLALPRFTASTEVPLGLADTDVQFSKAGLSLSAELSLDAADIYIDITRAAPLEKDKAEALLKRRDDLRFATRETKKGSKEEQAINDDIRLIDLQLAPVSDVPVVRILPKSPDIVPEEICAKGKVSNVQPIAVFYSTARFFSRLPPVLPKTKSVDLAAAYDKALNQMEVSLNDFANWYRVLVDDKPPELTTRMFQQLEAAVSVFLPGVSNLQIHADRPPRFSVDKNCSHFYLEQLSDGERGLLALVFDLTRRLAIANPNSNNPIAEGVALVMIDEIELHLHPKWQRQVLRRLRDAFKNCQFVVTSHSPQVIGQVRPEALRLLHHDASGKVTLVPVAQSFGMDSNWILQNVMGVPARDYETEQRLSTIYQAIDEGKLQDARALAESLRSDIGDFPDLQEALALLDRFELLGSE